MNKPLKIVVVGGGSAGYFAAAAIARNCKHVSVTVVHDPGKPSIGVGESLAWGVPDFMLNTLGLTDEFEWMREVHATYKHSVRVQGFDNADADPTWIAYPFAGSYKILERSMLGGYTGSITHGDNYSLYDVWMHLYKKGIKKYGENWPDLNEYYWYARYNTSPVDEHGNYFTLKTLGYSYHVDASLVGPAIHKLAGIPNGVKEIKSGVAQVNIKDGKIKNLLLQDGQVLDADLFIDSTGFAKVLIKQLPDAKFNHADEYANDSCLVGPDPFDSYNDFVNYTQMIAMPNGWRFRIPSNDRYGNGYVFHSKIVSSEDQIVSEFEKQSGRKNVIGRRIKWEPGYYDECFVGNCLTIGVSYGFIDAFDANNLSAATLYIKRLIKLINADAESTFNWKNDFNYYAKSIAEDIKFRLQCAFHLAPRNDTPYWNYMKEAAKKYHTLERLQDTLFDDKRRKYLGFQNAMFSQHTFLNTAMYYNLPIEIPDMGFDDKTEQLALNWFGGFNRHNQLLAKNSIAIPEFYRRTLYPDLNLPMH